MAKSLYERQHKIPDAGEKKMLSFSLNGRRGREGTSKETE